MDGISGAAQSIDAVNQLLQVVTKENADQSVKLMKVTVATAVGQEVGKGGSVDMQH